MKQVLNCFVKGIFRPMITLILVFMGGRALSQPVNIVFAAPASVQVNTTFTVDVKADFTSAGTLNVMDVYINFNPLDLEVVSTPVVPAGTAAALPGVSTDFASVATMNSTGRIDYGRFNSSASGHPSADFTFFTITFKALRETVASLAFNTINPRRTIALEGLTIVSNQITNSSINITSCAPPNVSIASTGSCNGQPFNVYLQSATSGVAPFDIVVNGVTYNDITPGAGGTFLGVFPPIESIWPGNPVPESPDNNDGGPIETGVKFRSSTPGFIKGVRFYLGNNNAGTYTGKLYNSTGTVLQSQQFTSVTTNGWQELTFTSPVQISANTTYIASVFSSVGNYAQSDNFFTTSGVTTGSLTALAEGVSGSNGVYNYGAAGFPMDTWVGHSPNYWIDVMFVQSTFTYNLTSVTDNTGCPATGSPNLQTLVVTSADCATLPVTLLNLSASPQNKNVLLRWATSTELDNKGFEIQRSSNGSNWEGIGYVNGAGNSSILRNYSYLDEGLFPRRYYYRLKQEDIDGHYKYSMVVSVLIEGKGEFSLGQNYPNPFRTVTTIPYTLAEKTQVKLTVYDMNGRVMKVLVNEKRDAGTYAENLHIGSLPSGMYYYKLEAGGFSGVKKLILQ